MIGQSLPRKEDSRLVTGRGRYTDDFSLPDQAYAVFVRSPHAHARVLEIETSAARAMPGVLAVLTGADYLAQGYQGISHLANPAGAVRYQEPTFTHSFTGSVFEGRHLPLAVETVRHVGEAVVMVVAETLAQARDAADAVEVDYQTLPAVIRADDALSDTAPQLWDAVPGNLYFHAREGDLAAAQAAFEQAHCVVQREFHHSRVVNCQMEPRAALARYDAEQDRYTLISGSQGVSRQKAAFVGALGTRPDQIRVISPDVGGGFGPRTMVYVEQLAVLWAAKVAARPVKWTSDRSEAFVSDYQARDAILRGAMALDRDGKILAIQHQWLGNVGAHPVSYVPLANGSRIIQTVYHVPVISVDLYAVATNTVPTVPYRGAGRPEATHLIERLLDLAAEELGIDRIELRRRNLITKAQLPYRTATGLTYDSGDFLGNMTQALELADWSGFDRRRQAAAANGKLRGIGVANYVEAPVGAPIERVVVTIASDESAEIIAGTQSTGQGHETTFAQVLSAALGLDFDRITLRTGDTDFVSMGGGTHSDRSMRLVGTMLLQAAEQLLATAKAVVAHHDSVDPETLVLDMGQLRSSDAAEPLTRTLGQVAALIGEFGLPDAPDIRQFTTEVKFTGRMPAHPTGAAVCELEVDPLSGEVEICRYVTVDDSGRLINPMIVEGQVHGGLAQGLGQALYEGYHMDRESGQVLSGSFMDYGLMRAKDMPPLIAEAVVDPTHNNPLGVKGGGEGGTMPATACVFNALAHALRPVTRAEPPMPATPGALWDFLQAQSSEIQS